MAKVPAFAKAFAGRWRIVEMDVWDNHVLELGEEAHLSFEGAPRRDRLCRRERLPRCPLRLAGRRGLRRFSWQGYDDTDPASGRGWVTLGTAGRLVGHIFIHQGDNSGFVCERD